MTEQNEWVSLGEAAKLLGVHPTTVRNWADQGDIPFRRTPGRHRRFHRPSMEAWAAQQKQQQAREARSAPGNAQALVEFALGHTRFSANESNLRQHDWYEQLSTDGRDKMRRIGRRTLEGLLHHLEDKEPEGHEFGMARQIGIEYAEILRGEGLTLVQAVRGFVYFDDFLVESVVQMMAPSMSSAPSEWSDLLQQINAFTNEVLATMISHY